MKTLRSAYFISIFQIRKLRLMDLGKVSQLLRADWAPARTFSSVLKKHEAELPMMNDIEGRGILIHWPNSAMLTQWG